MEVDSDKWTQYATRQGHERPPRPQLAQIWFNRRLTIADYDKVHLQNFQYQNRNKHLDFDELGGRTLRVFSEKPSLIKKYVNLHEEIPEGLYEMKNARRTEALTAMDIKGMWKKLEREHPDAMKDCQQFEYHESVVRAGRKRKIFPSDSEMVIEAQKPLPKITAYKRTPKQPDKALPPLERPIDMQLFENLDSDLVSPLPVGLCSPKFDRTAVRNQL